MRLKVARPIKINYPKYKLRSSSKKGSNPKRVSHPRINKKDKTKQRKQTKGGFGFENWMMNMQRKLKVELYDVEEVSSYPSSAQQGMGKDHRKQT